MTTLNILVLPGDGIGPEVTAEALNVLRHCAKVGAITLNLDEGKFGGASIDAHGVPITEKTLSLATSADAVLMGAVGGPKWDALPRQQRAETGLLTLRSTMGVYANLRPAKIFPSLAEASPLRVDLARQLDFLVVRELIGGLYFGEPRGISGEAGKQVGVNTMAYTEAEIVRIGRVAFEAARRRKKKLCSIDKANVLEVMMLWRRVMTDLGARDYADVELSHMYVDNASMQVILNPGQFDVLVCENMFGDILSDEAGAATGSIGLLPSASLGDSNALYEPIHGSAPDIAGKGVANPLAAILTIGMLFEHTAQRKDLAEAIERSVSSVLDSGLRTGDLWRGDTSALKKVGTREMGQAVLDALTKLT